MTNRDPTPTVADLTRLVLLETVAARRVGGLPECAQSELQALRAKADALLQETPHA